MSTICNTPGAVLTEREHRVPLVHGSPQRGTISVFTREVAAPDGLDRPYLVFLQGGPGFEATRPTSPPSGWLARALADFRVLLLDQCGTGRSTPVGSVIPGATPADQAEYLTHPEPSWIRSRHLSRGRRHSRQSQAPPAPQARHRSSPRAFETGMPAT